MSPSPFRLRLLALALLAGAAPSLAQPSTLGAHHFPLAAARAGGSVPTGGFVVGTDAAYHSIDVAVDARGGYHAAFMTWAFADHKTVYYGYCPPERAEACATGEGWSLVGVSDDTPFVQLRLTPEGRPRLLLSNDQVGYHEGPVAKTLYRYAECDANCTSPGGWSVVELGYADYGGGIGSHDNNAQTFALDPEGRPRFLYFDGYTTRPDGVFGNAMYLLLCDTGCTNPANWRATLLPEPYRDHHTQLAIGPDGRPRVVAVTDPGEGTWLVYGECTAACAATSDWSAPVVLIHLPSGPGDRDWSFALDAAGRPRIAAQPLARPIHYLWCDAACDTSDGWDGYVLTFSNADTYPALALDAAARPRLAFKANAGLAYAWCDGGCETDQPAWSAVLVDSPAEIAAALSIPILPGCLDGSWIGGYRPQIALDPAGNPVLGHDAEFLMRCYETPQNPNPGHTFVEAKWWTSRVLMFPHPGGGGTHTEPGMPSAAVTLSAGYPNPFREATTVAFTLPSAGPATLTVYDALGREVAVLTRDEREAGPHEVTWDASGLPSGRYVVRLAAGGQEHTQALTLVR
jgi:hypothetical protein